MTPEQTLDNITRRQLNDVSSRFLRGRLELDETERRRFGELLRVERLYTRLERQFIDQLHARVPWWDK